MVRTGHRKLLRVIKGARVVIDTGVTELLHLALHPTDHPRKVELNVLVEEPELTSEFQRLLDIELNNSIGTLSTTRCVCVCVCLYVPICLVVDLYL